MPTAAEIKRLTEYIDVQEEHIQRVSFRPRRRIQVVESDPAWPAHFEHVASLIRAALGPSALKIEHVGSTSVAGLAAKPVIDVDLTVKDTTDEAAYVPALEAAGFQFLHREPHWHEHRFFGLAEPDTNLHVFGPNAPELKRHIMFRDWLREHPQDRAKYAAAKQNAAEASQAGNETGMQYNARKHDVVQEILARMFKAHGLVVDEAVEEDQK